jgi:hypothetical protein
MADTVSDLLVDSGGALAAALVALVLRRSGDRLTQSLHRAQVPRTYFPRARVNKAALLSDLGAM